MEEISNQFGSCNYLVLNFTYLGFLPTSSILIKKCLIIYHLPQDFSLIEKPVNHERYPVVIQSVLKTGSGQKTLVSTDLILNE